jgi:hypothetical protein
VKFWCSRRASCRGAPVDALPEAANDPEIGDLKTQVAVLQDEVDAAARDNASFGTRSPV